MKKRNNKMGVISWLINFKTLREEYYEMLDYSDKSRIDLEHLKKESKKVKDVLEAEIENLNIELENKNNKIKDLESLLSARTNRNLVLENAMQDRNKEIQELHHDLAKITLKLENKRAAFIKIRGTSGAYKKEVNKLREELEKAKKKIEFLKKKVPKKTLEDLKAYEYGLHEVLKRRKHD